MQISVWRGGVLTAQVGQDCQDAAVVVVGGLQVELEEDRRCALGDGALGDEQALGDGGVGAALRHQVQDLALARAEPAGWSFLPGAAGQPGDQAGSSVAATGTGSGGLAVIGAPTAGTTPSLAWNGTPGNPLVWFGDNIDYYGDVGVIRGLSSGEADWTTTPGTGAVYVLGF